MPLPAQNETWPPAEVESLLQQLNRWSAWYAGDVDELANAYRQMPILDRLDRPAQYRGGLTGAVARFWWGQPVGNLMVPRDRMHIPIAADICQASADLLFAEPPSITSPDTATQDRINGLLDDGLHATLAGAHEIGSALGGVYLRITWDRQVVPDRPFLTVLDVDQAVPEFRWGKLIAVTFWWTLRDDSSGIVLRHLERHELDSAGNGVILHGLYEGGATNLGRPVPLTEHPSTAALADLVDAESSISTDSPGLAVVFVPNQTPQRVWRHHPLGVHYGRSDLDGIEHLMDALDETMSSLKRDIRLGKARVIVARSLLENNGPGWGASFDLDQELFSPVNALQKGTDGPLITPVQFAIRVTEHLQAAQEITETILRSAGYSAQTFGEAPAGANARTATEVEVRDKRSDRTKDRKIRHWRPGVAAAIAKLLAVDNAFFAGHSTLDDIEVVFPDTDQESPAELAQTAALLRQAKAASTQTLVEMQHPDWDDGQVQAEVQRILAEEAMAMPDPIAVGEQQQGTDQFGQPIDQAPQTPEPAVPGPTPPPASGGTVSG